MLRHWLDQRKNEKTQEITPAIAMTGKIKHLLNCVVCRPNAGKMNSCGAIEVIKFK